MRPITIRLSNEAWKRRITADLYRNSLGALQAAIEAADPRMLVRNALRVRQSTLEAGSLSLPLSRFKRILVLGGGKASGAMAMEVEHILRRRIAAGVVNVPDNRRPERCRLIKLHPASHPVPSQSGVSGVSEMLKLAQHPTEDDLFICLISGGGSALMPAPAPGLTLSDKKAITNLMLKSGAIIDETNIVRKHLSSLKGGRLAEKLYPAVVVSLIISDVVGDRLDTVASGPTVPDTTSYKEAHAVLDKYDIWSEAPKRVRDLIRMGEAGSVNETPKPGSRIFRHVHNLLVGSNRVARQAAANFLFYQGFRVVEMREGLTGEAREVGARFSRELLLRSQLYAKPRRALAIVAGGETTVTVRGAGIGGRNQEFALSAAVTLAGTDGASVAALATDGVDGPTSAAGAIADGTTIARAEILGLDAQRSLRNNSSHALFKRVGDALVTGPTGTNVNDIYVALKVA